MSIKTQSPKKNRWLNWNPEAQKLSGLTQSKPTKPTEAGFDGFVGTVLEHDSKTQPLEDVLKGGVVELYSTDTGRLFIVADEADAAALGQRRGLIYTAAEINRVIQIEDPIVVAEIHQWKRTFNGTLNSYRNEEQD
jgi:hypothetical protein